MAHPTMSMSAADRAKYLPAYSWNVIHPEAQFVYCRNEHQANASLARLPPGDYGFDIEWRPNYRRGEAENPVALVQIASHQFILLIQISAMNGIPANLTTFLQSSNYIKCGVAIKDDVIKLYKDTGASTSNCVDLSLLARSVDNNKWKGKYSQPLGLARLTEAYLSLNLVKGKTARSDWQANLNQVQQAYAANDAHCAFTILQALRILRNAMPHPPSPKYFTFDCIHANCYEPLSETPWTPHNPDYDPGPPPPPRVPRPPTANQVFPQNTSHTHSVQHGGPQRPTRSRNQPREANTHPHPHPHSHRPNPSRNRDRPRFRNRQHSARPPVPAAQYDPNFPDLRYT